MKDPILTLYRASIDVGFVDLAQHQQVPFLNAIRGHVNRVSSRCKVELTDEWGEGCSLTVATWQTGRSVAVAEISATMHAEQVQELAKAAEAAAEFLDHWHRYAEIRAAFDAPVPVAINEIGPTPIPLHKEDATDRLTAAIREIVRDEVRDQRMIEVD